jgi:hypothetical protein
MSETDLHKVPGWTADQVERLAKSWINSAEQVVAVSATNGGLASLAQQLGVSQEEARRLVDLARGALSPEVRATMGQKFDDDRGLGAMPPGKEDGSKPPGVN